MPCSVRGDPWRLLSRDPPMPDPVRSTLSCKMSASKLRGGPARPYQPMASPLAAAGQAAPLPDLLHKTFSMQCDMHHQQGTFCTPCIMVCLGISYKLGPKTMPKGHVTLYRGRTSCFDPAVVIVLPAKHERHHSWCVQRGAEDCPCTCVSLAMRRRRPILASDMRSRSSATGLPASGLPAGLLCTESLLCQNPCIAQLVMHEHLAIIKQGSGKAPEWSPTEDAGTLPGCAA